jgi:hypothetical protein
MSVMNVRHELASNGLPATSGGECPARLNGGKPHNLKRATQERRHESHCYMEERPAQRHKALPTLDSCESAAASASYWRGKRLLGCEGGFSGLGEESLVASSVRGKPPGSVESPARVVCAC